MSYEGLAAYSSTRQVLIGLTLTARAELAKDGIIVSAVYPYITETNFYKNTFSCSKEPMSFDDELPKADSAGFVAGRILEVINSGKAEQFSHDWMKQRQPETTTA